MMLFKIILVASVINLGLVFAEEASNDHREQLYNEVYKLLQNRKMDALKDEIRKTVEEELDDFDIDRFLECAGLNEKCHFFKKCCGDYHCPSLTDGSCVQCVKQGQQCLKDKQCCPGTTCNRKFILSIYGTCGVKKNKVKLPVDIA